jgi:hypothetical protein
MASWHVFQSGQSLIGLRLPEPGHFNIWHIPAWLPAHCSLVWSEHHNDIGGPDIPSSGSAGQALFVLRATSGRAQLWDQVPASFGDEEAVVVHGRRGAEQLRITESNCSGPPPKGSSTGGLSSQNALYINSFPPYEVSNVDSSTLKVPHLGFLPLKRPSMEGHLNSYDRRWRGRTGDGEEEPERVRMDLRGREGPVSVRKDRRW